MTALVVQQWPIDRLFPMHATRARITRSSTRWRRRYRSLVFAFRIVARSDGGVVDGHLRLKAAQRLGLKREVPVALADDLSDAQIKAFRLLANRSASWAEWDDELLQLELEDLKDLGFDLAHTGFTDEELADLLENGEASAGNTDEDAVPEAPVDPVTKPDAMFMSSAIIGLLCGDSTVLANVEKVLDGTLADMVFTDPPYNVDYGNTAKDKMRGNNRTIMNDNLGDGFEQFLYDASANMLTVCKGAIYVCMSSSELHTLQKAFIAAGGKWSTFVIWAKNTFTLGRSDYQRQYEPILYGWKQGVDHFWCGARDQGGARLVRQQAGEKRTAPDHEAGRTGGTRRPQ